MMIKNISFKGYTNVLSTFAANDRKEIALYMTMQLNDEDGHHDLTEFKKIRKLQGLKDNGLNQDVINITYFTNCDLNSKLYFGSEPLLFGNELKKLYNMKLASKISEKDYKAEETVNLKSYTLLASLTKRIANSSGIEGESYGITRVIENLCRTLLDITNNQSIAYDLVEEGIKNKSGHKHIAKIFNEILHKNMTFFFK